MPTFFDDFNRANNADIGSDWTAVTGLNPFSISSNTALQGANESGEYVNSISPGDAQFAEAVLSGVQESTDDQSGIGPAVRIDIGASATFYALLANRVTTGELVLMKVIENLWTSLGVYTAGAAPVAGDTIRLEAEGAELRAYHETVLRITQTDATLPSGSVGITSHNNNENPALDSFFGGDLISEPIITRSRKLATQQRMVS